jgi:hypothetical protein
MRRESVGPYGWGGERVSTLYASDGYTSAAIVSRNLEEPS